MVSIATLDKHGTVGHVLQVNVSVVIVNVDSLANVATTALNASDAICVGKHAKGEATSVAVADGAGVAIDGDMAACCIEDFANSLVELVVDDGTPV